METSYIINLSSNTHFRRAPKKTNPYKLESCPATFIWGTKHFPHLQPVAVWPQTASCQHFEPGAPKRPKSSENYDMNFEIWCRGRVQGWWIHPNTHRHGDGWSKITHRMGWSNSIGILTIFFFWRQSGNAGFKGFSSWWTMFDSQRLGIPDRCFFEKVLGQQPALNFDFCSGNLRFLQYQKKQDNWYGCFQKWGYPKMDGLWWKTLLNWTIWGYHYFWKHPYQDNASRRDMLLLLTVSVLFFQCNDRFVCPDAQCMLYLPTVTITK